MLSRVLIFVFLAGLLAPWSLAHAESEGHKTFVYEKNRNIFLKRGGEVTQLTKSGRDREPILSPNGRWVAFAREIEGKVRQCEVEDLWICPRDELWIMDMETQSERLLLEPRPAAAKIEDVIEKFTFKIFSPDSKTIYFQTPSYATSHAIHAVDTSGGNRRFVTTGYGIQFVTNPLPPDIKKYLAETLKEDDWRIRPKKMGAPLIKKALNDDVMGYLLIGASGVGAISSPTPLEGGWKDDDGKYYKSTGRRQWTSLESPDGSMIIPLGPAE